MAKKRKAVLIDGKKVYLSVLGTGREVERSAQTHLAVVRVKV